MISKLIGCDGMKGFDINTYSRPLTCSKCGGLMIFVGVGEYRCEDCKNVEYDDYGKVRLFIEQNRGATAAQIEKEIGVSQKAIRSMLRESKIEITAESRTFMKCDICGVNIRSGRYCSKCETAFHRQLEEDTRKLHSSHIGKGFGMEKENIGNGEKRFHREK